MPFSVHKYSDKSIVVKGDNLKDYNSKFESLNGKYNPNLQYIGKGNVVGSREGFIFPVEQKEEIDELVSDINKGKVEKDKKSDEKKFVSVKEYLNLVSRVERLEQLIKIKPVVENNVGKEDTEEGDEEKSMLHKKKKKGT